MAGHDVGGWGRLATEKATVTAPEAVSAQALVAAVESAGYAAEVVASAGPAQTGPAQTRGAQPGPTGYLRRRLILALVFFVPLSDLSIMLSLFPAYRFAGCQRVLVVLTAPLASCAPSPFHPPPLQHPSPAPP